MEQLVLCLALDVITAHIRSYIHTRACMAEFCQLLRRMQAGILPRRSSGVSAVMCMLCIVSPNMCRLWMHVKSTDKPQNKTHMIDAGHLLKDLGLLRWVSISLAVSWHDFVVPMLMCVSCFGSPALLLLLLFPACAAWPTSLLVYRIAANCSTLQILNLLQKPLTTHGGGIV